MSDLNALLLTRIQFGFTVSFHIVFPALTIGLANYLAVLEGAWLRTKPRTSMSMMCLLAEARSGTNSSPKRVASGPSD